MEHMSWLNAGTAFLFGLLTFLSPCVLPLLPGYFSYIAGMDRGTGTVPDRRRRLILNSTGFVLGFGVLFIGMGAAASGVGQWLNQNRVLLTQMAGLMIIILGLHVSGLLPIKFLYRQIGWQPRLNISGWPGAFVLGLSFAAAWTPCVGPVLASILLLAGGSETMVQGVALLSFFTLGLAVPFMVAAFAADRIFRVLERMQRFMPYINAISGGLLIAMGLLLLLGIWDRLARVIY